MEAITRAPPPPPPLVQQQPILPPGFRFHPTDEELVIHYLKNKASSSPLPVPIITEIDLYKFDPWQLPGMACFGENEWYFFSPRDRKYPNGARPNRAAASGYWKATGTDKPITSSVGYHKVGVKKALVFYRGKPPKGIKTNWIMHEYRLVGETNSSRPTLPYGSRKSLRLDDWVLCRIYKKNTQATRIDENIKEDDNTSACVEQVLTPLPNTQDHRVGNLPKMDSFCGFNDVDPFFETFLLESDSASNYASLQQQQHHHQQQQHINNFNGVRFIPQLDAIQHNLSTHGIVPKVEHIDVCGIRGAFDHSLVDEHTVGRGFSGLPNLTQKYSQPPKSQLNPGSLETCYKWPLWQEEAKAL